MSLSSQYDPKTRAKTNSHIIDHCGCTYMSKYIPLLISLTEMYFSVLMPENKLYLDSHR